MTQKTVKRLKDYAPPAWGTESIRLEFKVGEDRIDVSSLARMVPNTGGGLRLDKGPMDVFSVKVDGRKLEAREYEVGEDSLIIRDPGGAAFDLEIVNRIYPKENKALSGIYESNGFLVSQCESEGFRNIVPFVDRPDNMCRFSAVIEAGSEYPVLLSNGNLIDRAESGGKIRAEWEDPFPKPAYLFAFVAGDLECAEDAFTTASGRRVSLKIYTEAANAGRCGWAMESLKRAMKWDEERYGLEYDLDLFMIVAVDNFNFGAMENKGLNIFNSKYLIGDKDCATDEALINIEAVVAHEYFHNWTGNRVTLRDWFQLSLKEGLTVFRTQQFTEEVRLGFLNRIREASLLRSRQFPEDAGPTAHPVRPESYMEINNFYTLTIYEKGAALINMAHRLLGDEVFVEGVKRYLKENDGRACVLEDFARALEEASGRDLAHFFLWYGQSGLTELSAKTEYDEAAKTLRVRLGQRTLPTQDGQPKRPLHLPADLAVLHRDAPGEAYAREERLVELREEEAVASFEGVGKDHKLALNRGFAAPVALRAEASVADCVALMEHETDGFTRWEAGQTVWKNMLTGHLNGVESAEVAIPAEFSAALGKMIENAEADCNLASACLMIPSYSELMLAAERFDPLRTFRAVKSFRKLLAEELEAPFAELYRKLEPSSAYSFARDEIGRRKLRNAALVFLIQTGKPAHRESAAKQYETADNLTARLGALEALLGEDTETARRILKSFEETHADDYSVFLHWFGRQAASPAFGSAARIGELMAHPGFRSENPNALFALFGNFTASNLPSFHAPGGEGYRLLTENILRQDRLNPSVSSQLCLSFSCFDRLAEPFREQMKPCLDEILNARGISAGLLENASRIAGGVP